MPRTPEERRAYERSPEYRAKRNARDAARKAKRKEFFGVTEYELIVKPREQNKAVREGFKSPAQRRRILKKAKTPAEVSAQLKRETLAYFGITEGRLTYLRALNARYSGGNEGDFTKRVINTYRSDIDGAENDWSQARVGYIISFYMAVVNPGTNWEHIMTTPPWKTEKVKSRDKEKPITYTFRSGNEWQYWYLVTYGQIQTETTYEERYGSASVISAKAKGHMTA